MIHSQVNYRKHNLMLKKVNYKKGTNHRILWYYSEKKNQAMKTCQN